MVDGKRGVRQTWPVALSVGVTFAIAQFVASNYLSVELTDIVAALAGLVAAVVTLKVWTPRGGEEAADRLHAEHEAEVGDRRRPPRAAPAPRPVRRRCRPRPRSRPSPSTPPGLDPRPAAHGVLPLPAGHRRVLAGQAGRAGVDLPRPARDVKIAWPGLDGNVLSAAGKPVTSTVYNFQWLSSPGLAAADLRVHRRAGLPGAARAGAARAGRHRGQAALGVPHRGQRCSRWPT